MRARRIGLAQINTTVGDIGGNVAAIRAAIIEARAQHCDIVGFPELAVTGYPAEDLLLKRTFCQASREAITGLAPDTRGMIAIVGFVDWREGDVYNAAAILVDGQWADTYDKRRLPNYGVFDEERYFSPGKRVPVYRCGDIRFGVSICEDIWYPGLPLDAMALGGAEICINLSASPYHRGRIGDRVRMLATRAADNIIAVAYTNQVGGQDELVFDGGSMSSTRAASCSPAPTSSKRSCSFSISTSTAWRSGGSTTREGASNCAIGTRRPKSNGWTSALLAPAFGQPRGRRWRPASHRP